MTGRVWTSDADETARRLRTVVRGVRITRLAFGRRRIFAGGFRGREERGPDRGRRLRRPPTHGRSGVA